MMMGMGAETPCDNLYLQNLPLDMTEETITQIFNAVGYKVVGCKVMPPRQAGTTCVAMVRFGSIDDAKFVLESFNGTQLPGFDKPLHITYASKPGAASGYAPGSGPAALAAALAAAAAGGGAAGGAFGGAGGAFGAAGGAFGDAFGDAGGFNFGGGGGGYGKAPVASMMSQMSQQVGMAPYVGPQAHVKIEPKIPGQSDNLYIKGLPANADESFCKQLFDQYGTVRTCKVLKKNEGDPRHALVRFSSVEEATTIINTLNGGMLEGFSTPLEISYAVEKTLANLGGPAGNMGGMASLGGMGMGGAMGGMADLMGAAGGCGGGDPNVEQMLDEWVKAKRMRDFATADSLRAILRAQGVDPDKARPVSTDAMLDEWVKAKRMRDFSTADSLRIQLRAQGIDPDTVRPGTM